MEEEKKSARESFSVMPKTGVQLGSAFLLFLIIVFLCSVFLHKGFVFYVVHVETKY